MQSTSCQRCGQFIFKYAENKLTRMYVAIPLSDLTGGNTEDQNQYVSDTWKHDK